ncbi:MAG: HPF/RaiA family ribosome-associated protein [Polyangiaceae bacterium]|nr:HPF/RaiA family ribosome-associated protein [Polyangiaceae bacterium]
MKLEIRWKGARRSEALSQHVHDRARCAFRPSADQVRLIVVRLEDMNGPKGGVDKRCAVEVVGPFGVRITEARDVDFYVAAGRALEMAGRSALRALDRRVEHEPTSIRTFSRELG